MSLERPGSIPEIKEKKKEIDCVITSQGSVYKYLPDGTTQRFKAVEGKEYSPQSAIVFVPDYNTLKKLAPPNIKFESMFGENETQYHQILLSYVQGKGKGNHIVTGQGDHLETNVDIDNEQGPIFLTFEDKNKGMVDFFIPVSKEPKIGYLTFDTKKWFDDQSKQLKREQHLGNDVVEIRYK